MVLCRQSLFGGVVDMSIVLEGKCIGYHKKPYIIAEIGYNHNVDMHLFKQIIYSDVYSGADEVKFQYLSKNIIL